MPINNQGTLVDLFKASVVLTLFSGYSFCDSQLSMIMNQKITMHFHLTNDHVQIKGINFKIPFGPVSPEAPGTPLDPVLPFRNRAL